MLSSADPGTVQPPTRRGAGELRPEIIRMVDVCKSYYMGDEELEVLHHVDLTVRQGEFVSILGPSGSGSPR